MKALIWIGCIFSFSLITTLIKGSGIILGGLPTAVLFAATWWIARTLCKKWDARRQALNKDEELNGFQDQEHTQI